MLALLLQVLLLQSTLQHVRSMEHITCSKCGKMKEIEGEVLSGELVLVNDQGCTGSLLSRMHVITTAQCVLVK